MPAQAVKQGILEALEAAFASGESAKIEELLASIETVPPGSRQPYLDAGQALPGTPCGSRRRRRRRVCRRRDPVPAARDRVLARGHAARARRVAPRARSAKRSRAAARRGRRDLRTARGRALARASHSD